MPETAPNTYRTHGCRPAIHRRGQRRSPEACPVPLAVARQTGAIVLGEFQIRSGDNFVIFRSGACPGQCHRERNGEAAKRQIHRCCPSADLPRRCGLGNIQALRGARKTGLARDVVDGSGSAAELMVRTAISSQWSIAGAV